MNKRCPITGPHDPHDWSRAETTHFRCVGGAPRRLFGSPGAELLRAEIEEVLDDDIRPFLDGTEASCVVEEWSVRPPSHHLPTADRVIGEVLDWIDECGEVPHEDLFSDAKRSTLGTDPRVVAAAEGLLETMGDLLPFSGADRLVATHTYAIAWVDDEAVFTKEGEHHGHDLG